MQNIIFKIIKTLDWGENYNPEQVDLFLQLTEEYCPQDIEIWQLRKICLFYKAQKDLPFEVFQKINDLVNDTDAQVRNLFDFFQNYLFYDGEIPKLYLILDTTMTEEFFDKVQQAIGWGLVRTLIFDTETLFQLKGLPMMLRTMLFKYLTKYKNYRYFTAKITSSLGWRDREKYFRPYQIWELETTNLNDLEEETLASELQQFDTLHYAGLCLIDLQEEASEVMKPEQIRVSHERILFLTDFQKIEVSPELHQEATQLMNNMQNRFGLDVPLEVENKAQEIAYAYAEEALQIQQDHEFAQQQFDDALFEHLEQIEQNVPIIVLPLEEIEIDPMDAIVPDLQQAEEIQVDEQIVPNTALSQPSDEETDGNIWADAILQDDVAVPEPSEFETDVNNLME